MPAVTKLTDLGGRDVTVLVDDVSDGTSLAVHLLFLFCRLFPHVGEFLVESDLLLQEVVGILLGLFLLGDLLLDEVDLFADVFGLELDCDVGQG